MKRPKILPREEGQPIRVVICDDSPFMRRMLRQGLERSLDIEVVGSAATAQEAIELVNTLHPDVLTLDLELPDMDGINVLHACRSNPVRVLVISTFTDSAETERAVEALAEGAVDVLGKPNVKAAPSVFFAQLLDRVRDIMQAAPYVSLDNVSAPKIKKGIQRLIVIGASTGGPRSLQSLLSALPADMNAPMLIVQHMPKTFTSVFAQRLGRMCAFEVVQATDGAALVPGRAYVAAAGRHLHVDGQHIHVRSGDPVNGLIPAIDVTMIEAAAAWGSNVTGVILTGIGKDGCEGARAIRAAGGRVIAESEDTCAVFGMPKAVIEAGLADEVVPLDRMAQAIVEEVYGRE